MNVENSFNKGFMQVAQRDAKAVRDEIMTGLNLTTRQAFRQRRLGKTPLKQSEKEFIENVFKRYGIVDVWGTESPSELTDKKLHIKREVQELVHFSAITLGSEGLDYAVNELILLSERVRSGKIKLESIVTN